MSKNKPSKLKRSLKDQVNKETEEIGEIGKTIGDTTKIIRKEKKNSSVLFGPKAGEKK